MTFEKRIKIRSIIIAIIPIVLTFIIFMNFNSNNFVTIDNEIYENGKVNYTIIDFGGENSITNYYSNLLGKFSENILNTN